MPKQRRYAVAIGPNGGVIWCEEMTKCSEGTPETWEPGNLSMVPDWVNLWAEDDQVARDRARAMWREKRGK